MNKDSPAVEAFTNLAADYGVWFAQIIRMMMYPEARNKEVVYPRMASKLPHIHETLVRGGKLSQIEVLQVEVQEKAKVLISVNGVAPIAEFDAFYESYEGLLTLIQRVERDMVLSDFGLDMATGFRSSTVMMSELARELERRSRRGQPFSVALLRIDDPLLRTNELAVGITVKAINKTIRTFDDPYVSGDGEFLISLKHSDSNGGLRFVTRFRQALADLDPHFTVSSCVAEPLPGDELPDLLRNVRADLEEMAAKAQGVTGQYEEVSPLNRFLQGLKGKDE